MAEPVLIYIYIYVYIYLLMFMSIYMYIYICMYLASYDSADIYYSIPAQAQVEHRALGIAGKFLALYSKA